MGERVCFVVAVCEKDYHYAKLCCESIRYFYPDVPIFLAKDGAFSTEQLEALPGVSPLDVRVPGGEAGEFTGLLTKLRLLFFEDSDRVFFLDADTVLIGPVLDVVGSSDLFVNGYPENKFNVLQASEERKGWVAKSFFAPDAIRGYDPEFASHEVLFFISGHFSVRTGVIPHTWVRDARPHMAPSFHGGPLFKYGDQGFLNYAFNKAAQTGRATLGYAPFVIFPTDAEEREYPEVRTDNLAGKRITGRYLLHFTGPSRRFHYGRHRFGSVLRFFADRYYARFPRYVRWVDYGKRLLRALKRGRLFRTGR
jgi:hypothetical protein